MRCLVRLAALLIALAVSAGCGGSPGNTTQDQEPDVQLGEPSTSTPKAAPAQRKRPAVRSTRAARPRPAPASGRPSIKQWPIPFSAARQRETEAYTQRHYGAGTARLDPKVIVEHYTVTPTAQATFDIFAKDEPDVELNELPGLCSHFLIDRDGTIYQLASLSRVCRHTVGLNDVAIGIEHVGGSDRDVLTNPAQLNSSLRLTAWLRCRFGIEASDVIGHSESVSSPYHHEQVQALKTQSHDDFQRGSMQTYRAKLSQRRC